MNFGDEKLWLCRGRFLIDLWKKLRLALVKVDSHLYDITNCSLV